MLKNGSRSSLWALVGPDYPFASCYASKALPRFSSSSVPIFHGIPARAISISVRWKYFAACDGAHSDVREALGVRTNGLGALDEHYIYVYFQANWNELIALRLSSPETTALPHRCRSSYWTSRNNSLDSPVRVCRTFGSSSAASASPLSICSTAVSSCLSGLPVRLGKRQQLRFPPLGIDLAVWRIAADGDVLDLEDGWRAKLEMSPEGAVLVRPDGFVAWRTNTLPTNPERKLVHVLSSILFRSMAHQARPTAAMRSP